MFRSLEYLEDYLNWTGYSLVETAFGIRVLPYCADDTGELDFFDGNLNGPQRMAVRMASNPSRLISIVHGPPGTGKTRTVVEIIRQCAKNGEKVLLCAPSNVGVDNVIERLGDSVKLVRLGHPARSHPNVQKYTLDGVMAGCDLAEIISDIRKEIDELKRRKGKDFQDRRKEIKSLHKELVSRERTAMKGILNSADVVCATLTSADPESQLEAVTARGFGVVVIDECAQGMEVACWLALLQGKRCVLAGDHCQLPPTIISDKAASGGLSRTLMERIQEEFLEKLDDILAVLTVQYRMNETIMQWASSAMYDGCLIADNSVRNHSLKNISNSISEIEEISSVLWLIDTEGCDMPELVIEDEESKGNPGEVMLCYIHIARLVNAGIKQEDIAVISPYNLQVQLLRTHLKMLYPKVAVRSVDGFQGQEREAVVLSLVRSNKNGEVGFLNDKRRINVAVTRARRQLAVICDTGTVTKDQFIKSLVDYLKENGTARSALEYNGVTYNLKLIPDQLLEELDKVPFVIDQTDLKLPAERQRGQARKENNTTVYNVDNVVGSRSRNRPEKVFQRPHMDDKGPSLN